MITDEQAQEIKKQLLEQIEKWPAEHADKKQGAKQQIQSMNKEQLEKFLVENKLMKNSKQPTEQHPQQCVFCNMIDNRIPTHKVDENKHAIAILEINPLSKGHIIVIPKKHVSVAELPNQTLSLAKKIAKKLKSKLKPEPIDIEITTDTRFDHTIINVVPIYENKKLDRKKAPEEELKKLQKKLEKKPRTKSESSTKKSKKIKIKKLPKAPRRIP